MFTLDRRKALTLGAVSVAAMSFGKAHAANTTPLRAVITMNGQTYDYREEQGADLGDFVSGFANFTQRCVRATVSGSPITVFFRPDRTSDRTEVVFELGKLFSGTPANLDAYSVVISRGADTLATIEVPTHYWFSRWRWQSAARPVVTSPSNLIAWDLLPPLARTAATGAIAQLLSSATNVGKTASASAAATVTATNVAATTATNVAAATPSSNTSSSTVPMTGAIAAAIAAGKGYYTMDSSGSMTYHPPGETAAGVTPTPSATATTPAATTAPSAVSTPSAGSGQVYTLMSLAGVTAYMPQTGERDDIGLVTAPQGKFLVTDDPASLQTLLAQAEAAGTAPWHMRDENTGAPINFNTYPKASWYPDGNVGSPQIGRTTNPVTVDSAHMPALAYVPYVLTGDPYFLEELQFQATWDWGALPPSYRPSIPQARQFAWSLRNLSQAARITPAQVPSWLLPGAYWANQLEVVREFFEANYVNGTRAEKSIFRTCTPVDSSNDNGPTEPGGTWCDPWEDEFVASVLGWVVAMGFKNWQDAFDWKIGSTIARTNGTSGWVRAWATPYRMILRYTAASAFAANWGEAFAITKDIQKLTYTDANTWASADMTYLTYSRGSLVYAMRYGTPGATACYAWANSQIVNKKWATDDKWLFAPAS